uniref:BRI1 kinase inhibitor 1 BKI1 n=1 Tax=Gymnema sylvestre TaxID=4068 RepID=A0A976X6E8_GYMSY|nr:BRI1 kinase inhibitor 1 BKI1 [Gymnema sylvestre]
MDSLLQPKRRNKDEEKQQQYQQQQLPTVQPGSPPSPTSSSPSREFSFAISLHQPPAVTSCCVPSADETKIPSSTALDLSPADDIFFHGHLLPLHLLSHLPVSPRSSTNSMDSFTLPIKDLLAADHHQTTTTTTTATDAISYEKTGGDKDNNYSHYSCYPNNDDKEGGGGRPKSKSFSWLSSKWRKENDGCRSEIKEKLEDKERQQKKRKLKLDVSDLLKRYMRMVRPLLSFRNSRRPERPQSYSFSGNLSFRRKQEDYFNGRRRGEFSAPASMRTSPTNSGLLVATTSPLSSSSTTSHDSTMEELQAAIQAAIAHCKNSIAVEDKIKCHHD